ncbi:MAG: restriction endonuclease subunit S, partial [Balneolales bacterium]|nr:restriction endonuclease subunit S [Balneolales bacterium]
YKQNEVGVIPEDWEVALLEDVCNMKSGSSITSKKIKNSGSYPCYGGNGLRGYTDNFTHEGDFALIGRQGALCGNLQFVTGSFFASEHAVVVTPTNFTNILLLYYVLGRMNLNQYSESSAQPGISVQKIKILPIPLPPTLAEQTAISAALSDMDALIEAQEQLITKKRAVKQGAMQELLKPKEGWKVKRLGEICSKITTGKLDANAMSSNGQYRFYTCAKKYYKIDRFAFDDEALLISGNGENVGYVHYYKGKFNAYQRTYVLTGFEEDIFYIKTYLDRFLSERIDVEVNAGNTPYIRMGTLTDMSIHLPSNQEEQIRISQILSDMDAEIEQLEAELDKYRKLKTGMMQELLTGRKRLV